MPFPRPVSFLSTRPAIRFAAAAWLVAACLLSIANSGTAEEDAGPNLSAVIGRAIEDFTLRDTYGQPHSLSDFRSAKAVVVAFVGTECPLAKLYAPRLVELSQEFPAEGATFLAINSNAQDSLTELAAYARIHEIPFPVLKDPSGEIAERFGAVRTPEVFILDEERTIRYRGRIDDQYGIGYQRTEATKRYLADALTEVLAGRKVSRPAVEAVGCFIGRAPDKAPTGDVTYSNSVADILNRRCVECHRDGQIASFPLTSYEEAAPWAETIAEVVTDGRMPPWYANPEHGRFRNDARLTDDEKDTLLTWIRNGCPEGDPSELPAPPKFVQGWRIPKPDLVLSMRKKPFTVPAEGVVDYQYFTVDPGFEEDKYVVAAEARPGNRSVVHHIIGYIVPPGQKDIRATGAIIGYAPGSLPIDFEEGQAIRIPAHSKIVFEMHYTPNGSEQQDCSHIGMVFAENGDVRQVIDGGAAFNSKFEIPPHAAAHVVTARRRIDRNVYLLNMTPHMHFRGKSFRYEARYPDGRCEILLDVPQYDFNWQLRYELAEPKLLPKGTVIYCTAQFDNSEANLNNPNPDETVRWGEQSWEEMMIGFYMTVPAGETDVAGAQ